jgi:hypothetical protein
MLPLEFQQIYVVYHMIITIRINIAWKDHEYYLLPKTQGDMILCLLPTIMVI